MIKEFAIQPEVLATWAHFRELRADFEVGCGRLICKYPKSWTREVIALVDRNIAPEKKFGEIRATAIKNYVTTQKHRFLPARGRTFEPPPKKTWQQNAEDCTLPEPFDGIIALENPRQKAAVLVAGEFDRATLPFATRKQIDIERTPAALAGCASKLLLTCSELCIIDPFFSPMVNGFDETLLEMLDIVRTRPQPACSITIHVRRPDVFIENVQKANYEFQLRPGLPGGCTLKVAFWSDVPGGMHPRYFLTEMGGIKYDWGFDERREADHVNEVILLENDRVEELRARYAIPNGKCQLVQVF
jgi:hypothetical protein